MVDKRVPQTPLLEPVDEKTPVSTYHSDFMVRIRDTAPPRPVAAHSNHAPVRPRILGGATTTHEPSVVVKPSDRTDDSIDPQPDTLHMAKRRYTRTLELTLIAAISALLAAAAALWLFRGMVGKSHGTPNMASPVGRESIQ
jgi:hypothetical protein